MAETSAPDTPPDAGAERPSAARRPALPWQAIVAATVLALAAAGLVLVVAAIRGDDATESRPTTRFTLTPADEAPGGDPLDIAFTDVDDTTGTRGPRPTANPWSSTSSPRGARRASRRCRTSQTVAQLDRRRRVLRARRPRPPRRRHRHRRGDRHHLRWSRDVKGDIAGAAGIPSDAGHDVRAGRRHGRRRSTWAPSTRPSCATLIADNLGTVVVIDAPLALAFASGMVAAVNPCGFAMLPAYVTFFLGHEGDGRRPRRVRRSGHPRGAARSASASSSCSGWSASPCAPWCRPCRSTPRGPSSSSASASPSVGVAMLPGVPLTARMPKLDRGGRSTGPRIDVPLRRVVRHRLTRRAPSASFIAIIVNSFSRTDFVSSVLMLVVYAAGMGLVITALTVAVALARESVVGFLRVAGCGWPTGSPPC